MKFIILKNKSKGDKKMKNTPQPSRPIDELIEETRNDFKLVFGRLLTQNEVVEITELIKQKLKEEGENE